MHQLFFWLNWHAGDLVLCRPLVRRILSQHDVQIAWGCWKNQAYLVQDLPVRVIADPRNDPPEKIRPSLMHLCPPGHVPIYLWIGAYPDTRFHQWETMVEIYNRQVQAAGLPSLRISSRFVPMVDFPHVDIAVADHAIFIENGPTRSGHCDFSFDMPALAREFPDLVFYCSGDPACSDPNVIDCSHLNLVQLSSLSNKCDAIAGKGSGPFCSTLTEANRYKPKAIMRFHPLSAGHTIWDYPGNPLQYLETHDELVRFLRYVKSRRKLRLLPGNPASSRDPEPPAVLPETVAAQLDTLIELCARNPSDAALMGQLGPARDRLVQFWLAGGGIPDDQIEPAYRGAWGKTVRKFLDFDVRGRFQRLAGGQSLPPGVLTPSALSQRLRTAPDHPDTLRQWIPAMLCFAPYEIRLPLDLHAAPAFLRPDLLAWLLQAPAFFRQPGEAAQYAQCLESSIAKLHDALLANPDPAAAIPLTSPFLHQADFTAARLGDSDLKDLLTHRGDLLQLAAQGARLPLDYPFRPRPAGRKIRVGILAENFAPSRNTSLALPFFEHLPSDFEIALYCVSPTNHPLESYCRSRATLMKRLPPAFADQLAMIRGDDLDILIFADDLTANTNPSCLLARHRLARRQITSIFSPVTTGFPNMDYFLLDTDGEQDSFREKILAIGSYCFSFGNEPSAPPVPTEDVHLQFPNGAVVFASAAKGSDMPPELLHSWAKILASTPESFLLLLPFNARSAAAIDKADFHNHLAGILTQNGVNPARLRVVDPKSPLDRQGLHEFLKHADIYLDSFPVSGSGALIEPLQHHLPIITKRGPHLRNSLAATLLQQLGLPQLVADSPEAYIFLAADLAANPDKRRDLSERIKSAMNARPAFLDSRAFAQRLVPFYKQLAGPAA